MSDLAVAAEGYELPDTTKRKKANVSRETAPKKTSKAKGVDQLANVLSGLTITLAVATKTPELALDETDSKMLSEALDNVMQHYDTQIPDSVAIWINLGTVVATITGKKYIAYKMRIAESEQSEEAKE